MATNHLRVPSTADLDPRAAAVIESYLDQLARKLPAPRPRRAEIIAELRDDLVEATTALAARSPSPQAAALTATADLGDTETLAAAFRPELAARFAHRYGTILLATGPMVGVCWIAAIGLPAPTPSWRWPLLLAIPLVVLAAPATVLTIAATGRLGRWLSPQTALAGGTIAGSTAVAADATTLAATAVVLVVTTTVPPALLAVAAAASLARLGFVLTSIIKLTRLARG